MLEETARLVGEKSIEIAERGIASYKQDHPECEVDAEMKNLAIQRVNSQLTFKLSELHITDDKSIEEQFSDWLEGELEESVVKICYRFLDEEQKKRAPEDDSNLSFLDKYLRDHKKKMQWGRS